MPKTIKDPNLHESVTIRKILEDHGGRILTYRAKNHALRESHEQLLQDYKHADGVALAEIRQILKETEPAFDAVVNSERDSAIKEYTANIEKRLG